MNWVSSASGKGINIDVDVCCAKTEPQASILEFQEKKQKNKTLCKGHPSQEGSFGSRPTLKMMGKCCLLGSAHPRVQGPEVSPRPSLEEPCWRQKAGRLNTDAGSRLFGFDPSSLLNGCVTLVEHRSVGPHVAHL